MIGTLVQAANDFVYFLTPEAANTQQILNFVGNQVPFFLLVFGILFFAIAMFGPQLKILTMPIAMLCIAASIAWYAMIGGSIFMLPFNAVEMIGVGIVVMVLAKMFGSALG